MMKMLRVLTSHDQLGDTGVKTGFWLEEFTAPYYLCKDAGADVVLTTLAAADKPSLLPEPGVAAQAAPGIRPVTMTHGQ